MSQDAHEPDGSPPSCASDHAKAEYWKERCGRVEAELHTALKQIHVLSAEVRQLRRDLNEITLRLNGG